VGLYPKPPTEGGIVKTASALLGAAATTTSITYVDLLTLAITTGGDSRLEIYASFAVSNAVDRAGTDQDYLRVMIDSTVLAETGSEQWPVTEAGALFVVTGVLAAGSHTVYLQWRTTTGGTLRCAANTIAAQPEHASIIVIETKG
jgi:hypothetical protein